MLWKATEVPICAIAFAIIFGLWLWPCKDWYRMTVRKRWNWSNSSSKRPQGRCGCTKVLMSTIPTNLRDRGFVGPIACLVRTPVDGSFNSSVVGKGSIGGFGVPRIGFCERRCVFYIPTYLPWWWWWWLLLFTLYKMLLSFPSFLKQFVCFCFVHSS